MRRIPAFPILLALYLVIAGCGGDVGGGFNNAQPIPPTPATLATVKLATTGTLPASTTIGSITVTVSANPSTGLTIAASDVSATGTGVGSVISSVTTNVAAVSVGLTNATGIQTGEFATLTYHVAAGTIPTAANFSIATSPAPVVAGIGTGSTAGIGVTILSVTVQ